MMELFERAQSVLEDRGAEYPSFGSEAASVVQAFNALTGNSLTMGEYVLILRLMKMRRDVTSPKDDNLIDDVAYAALYFDCVGPR